MARPPVVPKDTAKEINELGAQGYGRNTISYMTGINSSTVRNVLDGKNVQICEKLTTRQVSKMLCAGFRPVGR